MARSLGEQRRPGGQVARKAFLSLRFWLGVREGGRKGRGGGGKYKPSKDVSRPKMSSPPSSPPSLPPEDFPIVRPSMSDQEEIGESTNLPSLPPSLPPSPQKTYQLSTRRCLTKRWEGLLSTQGGGLSRAKVAWSVLRLQKWLELRATCGGKRKRK